MSDSGLKQLWIVADRRNASRLKQTLQNKGKLDRNIKLISDNATIRKDFVLPPVIDATATLCVVPTTHEHESPAEQIVVDAAILEQYSLLCDAPLIGVAVRRTSTIDLKATLRAKSHDTLAAAVQDWLTSLSAEIRNKLPSNHQSVWPTPSYRKYGTLLVFSSDVLSRPPWDSLAQYCQPYASQLFRNVCTRLKVTHIVVNAPIPLTIKSTSGVENVLRAPVDLHPLHGDFPSIEPPSDKAFKRALWATTKQNGIHQVFAPMYTMFSSGNITEKQRIMSDSRFAQHLSQGPCSAVDLYAGIGYFAFSYAMVGYEKVLCWEINDWSIEGLRRGAGLNGWSASVVEGSPHEPSWNDPISPKSRLVVFRESNEHALLRVGMLRDSIPPITHVNCGYLPSSKRSWSDAIRIIDPVLGGWIHAHENCAKNDIDNRGLEIEQAFQEEIKAHPENCATRTARCVNIEQVKSYAPGVVHCVFDMLISGT